MDISEIKDQVKESDDAIQELLDRVETMEKHKLEAQKQVEEQQE
jgi:hypothetical protein